MSLAHPPRQPWWVYDLVVCWTFLTRLPAPRIDLIDRPLMRSAWAFPVIGAWVGVVTGTVLFAALSAGLPADIAAWVTVGAMIALTGALHEDGLADLADGIGGGRTRERKLEILRDSRIGAFGVLALIVVIGTKAAAIGVVAADWREPDEGLGLWALVFVMIGPHALSRAIMVAVPRLLSRAREDGLGAGAGTPPVVVVQAALALGIAPAIILLPPLPALTGTLAAVIAAGAIAWLSSHHLGGYTGDVLGAAQQAAEVSFLVALATTL